MGGGGGGSRGLDEPPLGRKYWGNEKQITLGNSENWLLYFSCSLDYFLVNIIRKTGHMVSQHPISTMRRLNNYMRCTMGESRLPCLALMHINYDLPVDMEDLSQRTLILFFFNMENYKTVRVVKTILFFVASTFKTNATLQKAPPLNKHCIWSMKKFQ